MGFRTKIKEFALSRYYLAKWSRYVRIRDNNICQICFEPIDPRRNGDAHHIYPKSLYPEKAYRLDNGITTHDYHHQPVVHTTKTSWQYWVPYFKPFMKYKSKKEFNEKYQDRLPKL